MVRLNKGFPKATWEKDPTRRNEALDCRVYARAAAAIYGLDRFNEWQWRRHQLAVSPKAIISDHYSLSKSSTRAALLTPRPMQLADDPYL